MVQRLKNDCFGCCALRTHSAFQGTCTLGYPTKEVPRNDPFFRNSKKTIPVEICPKPRTKKHYMTCEDWRGAQQNDHA